MIVTHSYRQILVSDVSVSHIWPLITFFFSLVALVISSYLRTFGVFNENSKLSALYSFKYRLDLIDIPIAKDNYKLEFNTIQVITKTVATPLILYIEKYQLRRRKVCFCYGSFSRKFKLTSYRRFTHFE